MVMTDAILEMYPSCRVCSLRCHILAQTVPDVARLSATSNGLAMYAATNLTLRGEPADGIKKLVKWDSGAWQTAIRDWGEKHEYQRLQEDASGQVQIYTAIFPCTQPLGPCVFCICLPLEAGIVYWRNRDTGVTWELGYGVGGVSDNGAWAVTGTDVPAPDSPEIRRVRLWDGQTEIAPGVYTGLSKRPVRRLVADNGTIAITRLGYLHLWRPGAALQKSQTELPFESYAIDPKGNFILGAGGTFVRWQGTTAIYDTLYVMDLGTRAFTAVIQTPNGIAQPDLASDGHTAAFISSADWDGKNPQGVDQAWLVDLGSGSVRQLTTESAGVKEIALAGNASAVFAVTGNLRIVRIDLSTGDIQEIAPSYPTIRATDPVTTAWAPGGRYWLWGNGFGNPEVLAGGASAEIISAGDDAVEFTVPQDAPVGDQTTQVGAKGSPFQPADIKVSVAAAAPAFLGSGGRGVTWLHDDMVTPVTTESPARLGETLMAHMTGMGPVDASGRVTILFAWSLVQSYVGYRGALNFVRTPLQVIESRLTADAGVFLTTVRLPDALPRDPIYQYTYEGIEAALPDRTLPSLSRLPLRLP